MAWENTLLEASFNGIVFDIVKTDDSAENTLVEHSYPYVDGSDIENMGRGARHVNVEAVFYGDDYEEKLQDFLDALGHPVDPEFIHPVFGSFKNVQVARHVVRHDADNPDYATVTVEFVESTTAAPFFTRSVASQKAAAVAQHGAAATAAAGSKFAALMDRLKAANPMAALNKLREAITGPILAITAAVNTVLSGLDVLAYPLAWANDIKALVGGLLDIRDWADQLAADWASIQSGLNAFSIFSTPSNSASEPAPAQVTSGNAPTEEQVIAAAQATIQVNTAVGLSNAASYIFEAEAVTPTLTPTEIEAITAIARAGLEVAIEQVRAIYGIEDSRPITEALKDQGLALQEASRAVIVARPPLIQRMAEAPGNFRLLAHLWYGDHTRAPELYRLNGARSPFVNTGDSINAYAN
jgi:prophage DNA circulation protein